MTPYAATKMMADDLMLANDNIGRVISRLAYVIDQVEFILPGQNIRQLKALLSELNKEQDNFYRAARDMANGTVTIYPHPEPLPDDWAEDLSDEEETQAILADEDAMTAIQEYTWPLAEWERELLNIPPASGCVSGQ